MIFRDVSTGVTGTTSVAPKFSDNPIRPTIGAVAPKFSLGKQSTKIFAFRKHLRLLTYRFSIEVLIPVTKMQYSF